MADFKQAKDLSRSWFREKALLGIKAFVCLSLAAQLGIFFYSSLADVGPSLNISSGKINYYMLAIPLFMSFLEGFIGGMRTFLIMRVINPRIRYTTSVKAEYGNIFLGAATPTQTGGGLAQIYFITRDDIPVSEATAGAILTFICTLVFLAASLASVFIFPHANMGRSLRFLVGGAAVTVATVTSAFFLSVALTDSVNGFAFSLFNALKKRGFVRDGNGVFEKRLRRFSDALYNYRESALMVYRNGKSAFFLGFILTCAFFANRFIIPYFIVAGLGMEAGVVEVLQIQLLINLINYFSPSPGPRGRRS